MKAGDRIVTLKGSDPYYKVGDTGTIDRRSAIGWWVQFDLDKPHEDDGNWSVLVEHMKLLPSPKSKKIGVATIKTWHDDGTIMIRYHDTDVATKTPAGTVILNAGGWYTQTTKKRINAALGEWATGWYLYQKNFTWYLTNCKEGHTIPMYGKIELAASETEWVIKHRTPERQENISIFPRGE